MPAKSDNTAEREIVIERLFDAPRELVFAAWTDPKHLAEWWGPRGFTITTEAMEIRPGGEWRFVMHGPDGRDYGNVIRYREIIGPERMVYDHGGTEGKASDFVTTTTFEEIGGRTKVTMRAVFPSAEARMHAVKGYGAIEGAHQMLDRFGQRLADSAGTDPAELRIVRTFNAPRDVVFKAWTEAQRLAEWWGPKGFKKLACKLDLRVGGSFHYGMEAPDGMKIWGKFVFRAIVPPERLEFVDTFSDETGGVTRHPFAAVWPAEVLNTVVFLESGGRTTMYMTAKPINATEAERAAFKAQAEGMRAATQGMLDALEEGLAKA